jgi:23S rRNA (guanosine2251-2'-O)-methyltransferase
MLKKEKEKFVDSEILEGMSSISALIKACAEDKTHNDRHILKILIDQSKKKSKMREIAFLSAKSHELGFSIEFVNSEKIDEITLGNSHGGIIAICSPRTLPALSVDSISKDGVYYYLEGVEDPYNFGYAVRSLYASGADGLVVPPRNWMGAAGVVARSSAGASELLPLFVCEVTDAISLFHDRGYSVVCAGIRDSVSIFETELKKPLLVILGGEKRGISQAALSLADTVVRIDYGTEFRGSLSTAAAAAVFGFEILRQNQKDKI